MGAASFVQSSFLGGSWSKRSQGRTDLPKYRQALNICKNFMPAEEGSLPRRPGFEYTGVTRLGNEAKIVPYSYENNAAYALEFTDGFVQVEDGPAGKVYGSYAIVTGISTATPAVMTVAAQTWPTGTQLDFYVDGTSGPKYPDEHAALKLRPFVVTRLSSTTFALYTAVGHVAVDGAALAFAGNHVELTAAAYLEVASPWTGTSFRTNRIVQNEDFALVLNGATPPYKAALKVGINNDPHEGTLDLALANILDGPYLDIDTSGASFLAVRADPTTPNIVGFFIRFPAFDANHSYNKGEVAFTSSGGNRAWISLVDNNLGNAPIADDGTHWLETNGSIINGTNGVALGTVSTNYFTSGDIGRCVRVLCDPGAWSAATTFAKGAAVTYNDGAYISQVDNNINIAPDTNTDYWLPSNSPSVSTWTWGRIVSIAADLSTDPLFTLEILGPAVLYTDPVPITTFRFGLYGGGGGFGWPTCGLYHQGRLWLSGAVANRVDGSKSDEFLNFAPTSPDGSVADNNAVAYVFNAEDKNQIMWMQSTGEGIMAGTLRGEWFIRASQLNDPITPTSVQAHRQTKYGCANVLPASTPFATVFVQAFGRKVMEMLSDVFSGKFSAINLTEMGRHLTTPGIAEIVYQEEPVPTIWVRKTDGKLAGITYRRNSAFVSEAPSINAWHEVELAGDLTIKSICVLPSFDKTGQVLAAVVYDNDLEYHKIIQMVPLLEEEDDIYSSWFMDDASKAYNSLVTTVNNAAGIKAFGLWHLEGQTIDAFIGGLDCGQTTVTNGAAFVAFGADPDGLFTLANMQALSNAAPQTYNANTSFSAGSGATAYIVPMLFGHAFESEGQSLRPGTSQEAGAFNGPPLGKTRRAHMGALLLHNAVTNTIEFGTKAGKTFPVKLTTEGGTPLKRNQLFEGTFQTTLADDYNFDTMLYWKITRPVPATISQVGAFLHTQDR